MRFSDWTFPQTRLIVFQGEIFQVSVCKSTYLNDYDDCDDDKRQLQIKKIIFIILNELKNCSNKKFPFCLVDSACKISVSVDGKRWSLRNKYRFFLNNQELFPCPFKITCVFDF